MSLLKSLSKYIVENFFTAITTFGTPVFYIFIILLLWGMGDPFAFKILGILLLVEVVCIVIKFFYNKERPIAQKRDNLIDRIDSNSFPSIHTARISALAFSINFLNRFGSKLFIVLGIFLIIAVGYSRIYLKKHYIKDVVFGFLIGSVIALAILYI